MAEYHVSAKVRFKFRFDTRMIEVPPPDPNASPGEPASFGEDFYELGVDVVPYDANVQLNSYREADTANVTIPFASLPIDPRAVRAGTMQIFMGTVTAEQFAAIGPEGSRGELAVVPDIDPETNLSNEVFRGFFDTLDLDLDDEQFLSIEARDTTQFLIDAKMPVQGLAGIPATMPLDEVIRMVIVGEPSAGITPESAPTTLKQNADAGKRQDVRGMVSRSKAAVASTAAKIAKLTAAAATGDARIPPKLEELGETLQAQTEALAKNTKTLAEIDKSSPILIQRYGLPGARGFAILNETQDDPLPSFGDIKGPGWKDSKGHLRKGRTGGSKEQISYWDFCTDLVVAAGYIIYVRSPTKAVLGVLPAAEIVISEPRTYYQEVGVKVTGSKVEEEIRFDPNEIREFFFGINCRANVKRELTGHNVPKAIEVLAREQATGRHISARFPPKTKTNRASASATRAGDREEVLTLLYGEIPGDKAQATLERIARTLYDQVGRKEITINIRTHALSALPSNADSGRPDMFQLRAGDSVRFGVASGEIESSTVTQAGVLVNQGIAERVETLMALGFNIQGASAGAEASAPSAIQDVYRVRQVSISWNHAQGYEFEVECINYLDARHAIEQVAGLGP